MKIFLIKFLKKLDLDKNVLKDVKKDISEKGRRLNEINKEADELFKDFKNDKQKKQYYEAASEIADKINRYGSDKMTIDYVVNNIHMGIYDDGQQSPLNAYTMYAYENGFGDKLRQLSEEHDNLEMNINKSASEMITNEMNKLGDLSYDQIRKYKSFNYDTGQYEDKEYVMTTTAADIGRSVVSRIIDSKFKTPSAVYQGMSMVDISDPGSKKAMEQAKTIMSNLGNNKNNRWWYLDEAIDNLNLYGKMPEDLTSSDWKKINEEIDRLS